MYVCIDFLIFCKRQVIRVTWPSQVHDFTGSTSTKRKNAFCVLEIMAVFASVTMMGYPLNFLSSIC